MKRNFLAMAVTLLCVIACTLGFVSCDNNNSGNGNSSSERVSVENVTLDKTELTLDIGGEETLTATVTPDNATDKTVVWSSDNTAVATVENGKITAIAEGTATVTATADGKSAACSVTVNELPPTYEVTAEQWVQIMNSATKFTIKVSENDTIRMTIKVDGDKRSQNIGQREQIYVKDGDNYSRYVFDGSAWTKSALQASDYMEYAEVYGKFLKFFKDDYSLFTYADGKYTAAFIDKTSTMNGTVTNMEVAFENGVLIGLSFYADTYYKWELENVGTTTIELPTNYYIDDSD